MLTIVDQMACLLYGAAVQEEAREMRNSYGLTLHKRALAILQRGPEQRAYEMAERLLDVKIARQQKAIRRKR